MLLYALNLYTNNLRLTSKISIYLETTYLRTMARKIVSRKFYEALKQFSKHRWNQNLQGIAVMNEKNKNKNIIFKIKITKHGKSYILLLILKKGDTFLLLLQSFLEKIYSTNLVVLAFSTNAQTQHS